MEKPRYSDDFAEVCKTVYTGVPGRLGIGAATCALIAAVISLQIAALIFILWCLGSVWEAIAFKRFETRLHSRSAEAHMLTSAFVNMAVTAAPIYVCIAQREIGLSIAAGFYASATTLFLIILYGRYTRLLFATIAPCAATVILSTGSLFLSYWQAGNPFMAISMLVLPLIYGLVGLLPHHTLQHRDRQLETLIEEAEAQRERAERERQEAERQRQEAQAAKREADEANKAKSHFLASMSHEIRTPMNGILGMTDLMMNAGVTEQQRRYGDIIQTSGKSLLVILNDILDFSKLEAGEVELHPDWINLKDLIHSVASLQSANLKSDSVRIEYWVDPAIPDSVFVDDTRLQQILMNLVSNAVKFTETGHVRILARRKTSSEILSAEQTHIPVSIQIQDTGIGIAPDKIDRIFEKFVQAESGTTRAYGGTGLGLAICRDLVTLLGGSIHADSKAGIGSTFTIELPLALSDKTISDDPANDRSCESELGALIQSSNA